jgi:hypothetical protein
VRLRASLLFVLVCVVHATGANGAFVLDDHNLVHGRRAGHDESSLLDTLFYFGGNGSPAAGRPVVALSFLANFAASDPAAPDPFGFHVVNIAAHAVTALLMFLWLTATFERVPAVAASSTTLAFASTLLWALHPLTTSSVTQISQRAESLMSLFLLASLLALVRADGSPRPRAWWLVAVACACLSTASKEVGAVTPILLLLYDRTFLAGGFRRALRTRRALYVGLLSCWLLAGTIIAMGPRTASVGLFYEDITPLNYLLTQGNAIVHYLTLLLLPSPLLIDYGWPLVPVTGPADLLPAFGSYGPALLAVGGAFALGVYWLRVRPMLGFAFAWFFVILGPSSSVVPVATEIMAEHRMYLPSLAPIVLAVVLASIWLPRWVPRTSPGFFRMLGLGVLMLLCVTEGLLTHDQNQRYRSALSLYLHHLPFQPDNPRLLINLGRDLRARGDTERAEVFFDHAVHASRALTRVSQPFLLEALEDAADAKLKRGDRAAALALLREAQSLRATQQR